MKTVETATNKEGENALRKYKKENNMNIEFLKKWRWHKVGDTCWMSDSAAAKLIKEGVAKELRAPSKTSNSSQQNKENNG